MLHVEPTAAAKTAKRVPAKRQDTELTTESIYGLLILYRGLTSAQATLNGLTLHPEIGAEAARVLATQFCALDKQIDRVVVEALTRHPRTENEAHQRGMIVVDATARLGAWREVGNLAANVRRETRDALLAETTACA